MQPLEGRKIVLGISGSIAAYKSAVLCRLLIKAGADVRIVMTPSSIEFISPLTLSTLSKHPVNHQLIDEDEWSSHVELGLWGDLLLIAPATANTLASCRSGLCQNMLQAVYLSAKCPVVFSPAMDRDMWLHPSTTDNINTLKSYGNHFIDVGVGELASGLVGPGRMAEPEDILDYLVSFFSKKKALTGINVLVNAGPTYEAIDPVRFIGNHSSGKMGIAIARAFQEKGAYVQLVLGPSSQNTDGLQTVRVKNAEEMYVSCKEFFSAVDITVLTAAVADFTPVNVANQKIKKKLGQEEFTIELKKTKDIAKSLGQNKSDAQLLVGFALETEDEQANAQKKIISKNLDMIVLNSLNDKGAGFGVDTNKVKYIFSDGEMQEGGLKSKVEIAEELVSLIEKKFEKRINDLRSK